MQCGTCCAAGQPRIPAARAQARTRTVGWSVHNQTPEVRFEDCVRRLFRPSVGETVREYNSATRCDQSSTRRDPPFAIGENCA